MDTNKINEMTKAKALLDEFIIDLDKQPELLAQYDKDELKLIQIRLSGRIRRAVKKEADKV